MTRPPDARVAIRMLDLDGPLKPVDDVAGYPRTRLFVREQGILLGSVDIGNAYAPISASRLRDAIAADLGDALLKRAVQRQLASGPERPLPVTVPVSIVIPTCNRPEDLRRCLTAVSAHCRSRSTEVIVVDNRPGVDSPTPSVVRDFEGVRPVAEPKPGLSYARNAGFAAATGEILIAIDDDVIVPAGWLERLLAPFARPEVMAVTGHVLPFELETQSQRDFEAYGGLGKGFAPLEFDAAWFRAFRGAVPTWRIGATANAAFRSAILTDPAIGVLDEALGAGMPTGCSEDTYLFYRILKAGHPIVYEPGAWVWHRHRREAGALRRQIYSYSKGHVAYHLTTLLRDRDERALLRIGYSLPRTLVRRAWTRMWRRSEYPLRLIAIEVAGSLAGPWALWRARRRVRRLGPGARPNRPHAVPLKSRVTETSAA